MKIGIIVIPKKIREKFNINENTSLNILMKDNGFSVYPVKEISPQSEADLNNEIFLKLLRKNQGAWGKPTKEELKREKLNRKAEIAASKRNKQAW